MSKIHAALRPIVRPYDENRYIVVDTWHYTCPYFGIEILAKAGFIFDGASIPRLFWTTTGSPFLPQYLGPALAHDKLFKDGTDRHGNTVTMKQANQLMEYGLQMNHVSGYQRFKIYRGLQLPIIGGCRAWDRYRETT